MPQDGYGEDEATLGDRLTTAREAAGLSLPHLAAGLGVREATLAGWEADQAEPRAVYLSRIAGMLGVTLSWLLTGSGRGPAAPGATADADSLAAQVAELRRLLAAAMDRLDRIEERTTSG